MFTYPLLAQAYHDKTQLVPFTIADGPCPLTEDTFCLTNRPGTPILSYKKILLGMDINNLFEGDIIRYKGLEYQIKYQRGFNAISLNGDTIEVPKNNYEILTHTLLQNKFKQLKETRIRFKYIDFIFGIKDIYGTLDSSTLLVNNKHNRLIPIDTVQQYAGVKTERERKQIYFGDIVAGKEIILLNGLITSR